MGDVVLASAVLPFLLQRHPGASTTLVTERPYVGLYEHDSRLERACAYDKQRPDALIGELGGEKWDLAVDLQNNRRSRRLIRALAPNATVSRFDKLHLKRWLLLALRIDTFSREENVIVRYLRAAGWEGSPSDAPVASIQAEHVRADVAELGASLDPDKPVLGLVPFSAWRNKAWPPAFYARVGCHFADKGWSVVVFGGPEDVGPAARLCGRLGGKAVSLAGRTSLVQCAVLLSRCSVTLGNDTGLSHLARAVGTRTAVVYGSTTWHFGFYPSGEPPYRVLESETLCRPCHPHGGNRCIRLTRPCLRRVKPEQAVAALESLQAKG
jgi:heptosyltransferase-2